MVTSGCYFFITAKLFTRHATSVSVYCISSPLLPSRVWSRDLDNYLGLAAIFQRYTSEPLFTVRAGSRYNKRSGYEQDQRYASDNNAIGIYLFLFVINLESDRRISLYASRVTPREWETPQHMPRENDRTIVSIRVSKQRSSLASRQLSNGIDAFLRKRELEKLWYRMSESIPPGEGNNNDNNKKYNRSSMYRILLIKKGLRINWRSINYKRAIQIMRI